MCMDINTEGSKKILATKLYDSNKKWNGSPSSMTCSIGARRNLLPHGSWALHGSTAMSISNAI